MPKCIRYYTRFRPLNGGAVVTLPLREDNWKVRLPLGQMFNERHAGFYSFIVHWTIPRIVWELKLFAYFPKGDTFPSNGVKVVLMSP